MLDVATQFVTPYPPISIQRCVILLERPQICIGREVRLGQHLYLKTTRYGHPLTDRVITSRPLRLQVQKQAGCCGKWSNPEKLIHGRAQNVRHQFTDAGHAELTTSRRWDEEDIFKVGCH